MTRLTEDDNGVGVIAATTRNVTVAVGLLVRVGTSSHLFEQVDDLVCLGGSLGLDAAGSGTG